MEHQLRVFKGIEETTERVNETMRDCFFGKTFSQGPEPISSGKLLEDTKKNIAELVDALDDFYQTEWAELPRDVGSKAGACKHEGCKSPCEGCE